MWRRMAMTERQIGKRGGNGGKIEVMPGERRRQGFPWLTGERSEALRRDFVRQNRVSEW